MATRKSKITYVAYSCGLHDISVGQHWSKFYQPFQCTLRATSSVKFSLNPFLEPPLLPSASQHWAGLSLASVCISPIQLHVNPCRERPTCLPLCILKVWDTELRWAQETAQLVQLRWTEVSTGMGTGEMAGQPRAPPRTKGQASSRGHFPGSSPPSLCLRAQMLSSQLLERQEDRDYVKEAWGFDYVRERQEQIPSPPCALTVTSIKYRW